MARTIIKELPGGARTVSCTGRRCGVLATTTDWDQADRVSDRHLDIHTAIVGRRVMTGAAVIFFGVVAAAMVNAIVSFWLPADTALWIGRVSGLIAGVVAGVVTFRRVPPPPPEVAVEGPGPRTEVGH